MENNPMSTSPSVYLDASDRPSDSTTTPTQVQSCGMPEFPRPIDERGAFDRSAAPDHFRDPDAGAFPITTQALPNSFDAEIRKKIVLNNVLDRSPNPNPQSDWDDVCAILYAIGAEFLRQNIRGIQREGHFEPNGRPRPVVVIFHDESAQRVAVEYGPRLANVPYFRHISLHAYEPQWPQHHSHQPVSGSNFGENRTAINDPPERNLTHDNKFGQNDNHNQQYDYRQSAYPPQPQHPSYPQQHGYHQQASPHPPWSFYERPPAYFPSPHHPHQPHQPPYQHSYPSYPPHFNPYQQTYGLNQQDPYRMNPNYGQVPDMSVQSDGARIEGFDSSRDKQRPRPEQPPPAVSPQLSQYTSASSASFDGITTNPCVKQESKQGKRIDSSDDGEEEKENAESENSDGEDTGSADDRDANSEESKLDNSDKEVTNEEPPEVVNELFKAQSEQFTGIKKVLNILVLGETGVGKSTWINGIANYMAFNTLEDALQARQAICLIPSKFSFYQTNEEKIEVRLDPARGEIRDENESFSDQGQSSTQEPKTYQFETAKYIVNIIDTPGIGDTRGVDQDKENSRKILAAIGQYKHLHAICLLCKANEVRMTLSFQYCISEIFLQLDKNTVENLFFFFTNSRGTFYKPGDTMGPLSEFIDNLHKNRGLRIRLTRDKIFCTDNEAFRLVCAHFSGARFNDVDFEKFAGSWRQSAQEMHRFIEFAAKQVADTVSVNKARTIIYNLARPLANVNELTETKIRVFEDRKNDLQSTVANLDDLKKMLMIPQIGIEVKPLDYPKTVCSATKCIDAITLPYTNQQQTVYKQICHDHCYLSGVDVEKAPEPHLRGCAAMNGENCGMCKCSWKDHMHIRFEQFKTSVLTEDKTTKALIQQKSDATKVKEQMIKACENEVNELKAEQQKIIKTSLRFGSFLQANAILPYNDAFEKYVEQSIAEEEKCVGVGGNRTKLNNLRKLLKEYQEERRMLLEAQKNPQRDGGNTIAPDEIEVLKAELFSLKNTGKTLQSLFAATEDGLAKHQSFTTVKWERPKEIQPANFGIYKKPDVKEKPGTSKTEKPQKPQKEAKGSKKGKAKKN